MIFRSFFFFFFYYFPINDSILCGALFACNNSLILFIYNRFNIFGDGSFFFGGFTIKVEVDTKL